MLDFRDYISTLSLEQLREHQNILDSLIASKHCVSICPINDEDSFTGDWNVNDYVTYQENFSDNTDVSLLLGECLSMGFRSDSRNYAVQNKFVSPFSEPYCWNSGKRSITNNPVDLNEFPSIKRTLNKINSDFGFKLNCALVSYYKNGEVCARLHADDETELDQTQPIVVVSLGAVRTVQFVDNRQESFRSNALSFNPSEGSLYIMKAGCQQKFRHRVRMNKRIKDYRISISFRAFKPQQSSDTGPVSLPPADASSPISNPSDSSFATAGSRASVSQTTAEEPVQSPVIVKQLEDLLPPDILSSELRRKFALRPTHLPVPVAPLEEPPGQISSTSPLPKVSHDVSSININSKEDQGYSPFPVHTANNRSYDPVSKEKLCVIFGTSITEFVEESLMSKGNRTVVNISSSGANIQNIRKMAEDFHFENPKSLHKIDKIIVSVGTNDIKWYNSFKRNMRHDIKPKLVLLIEDLKKLYPSAQIHFHTVLPMRVVYKYTATSVHQFNNILFELCCQYGCIFFDCFARFLNKDGVFYNRALFRDNWHLNNAGLKVFCRALKFLIYGKLFNPLPRYSFYPRFYPC